MSTSYPIKKRCMKSTASASASAPASSKLPIAAIVGVGPNLGLSIARKFAKEGYIVAILSRDLGKLTEFAKKIAREGGGRPAYAIAIDCSNPTSVKEAFESIREYGYVEVLIYNAYQPPIQSHPTPFCNISIEAFQKSLAISCSGAFQCAQEVLPSMVEKGRGTIIFTGCSTSVYPIPGYSDLCCGKFALRALSQCLANEFKHHGVHIAHVIIHGVIGPPRGLLKGKSSQIAGDKDTGSVTKNLLFDPDVLAQTFWQLHVQHKSAWTHEIDVNNCL